MPPAYDQDYILYISASHCTVAGVIVQEEDTRQENVVYYISKKLSGPALNYSHEEKLALVVFHSFQKLRHYILLRQTRVVANSNPMQYILGCRTLNWKYAWWVVILQEYDLDFSTPKSKRALAIVKVITDLPSGTSDLQLDDQSTDERLFHVMPRPC